MTDYIRAALNLAATPLSGKWPREALVMLPRTGRHVCIASRLNQNASFLQVAKDVKGTSDLHEMTLMCLIVA